MFVDEIFEETLAEWVMFVISKVSLVFPVNSNHVLCISLSVENMKTHCLHFTGSRHHVIFITVCDVIT